MSQAAALLGAALVALAGCTPSRGVLETRYPGGAVRWRVPTEDGRPHGESVVYDRDGRVVERGVYRHGERHGLFVRLDAQGGIARRTIYVRDQVVWESGDPASSPPVVALDDAPAPPIDPDFTSVDRPGPGDRYLARVGVHRVARPEEDAAGGGRAELYGQYTAPNAIAIYGALTTATLAGNQMASSGVGKTVVELGAAWIPPRRRLPGRIGDAGLVLRAGAFVPVAGDDLEGYLVNASTSYERLTDTITAVPGAAGARGSASMHGQLGGFYYRADLGLDAAFATAGVDDAPRASESPALLGRLNVAGGWAGSAVGATVELVNVLALNDPDAQERGAHAVSLSGRYRRGRLRPQLGLVTPVEPRAFERDLAVFAGVELVEDCDR